MSYYDHREKISALVGRIPSRVVREDDGVEGGEELRIHFTDGTIAVFYHEQDCCESVAIESVTGDWQDIIGHPLLVAEERTDESEVDDFNHQTWTFYTFRGIGGSVDVRWLGQSNGYYSERVSLALLPVDTPS